MSALRNLMLVLVGVFAVGCGNGGDGTADARRTLFDRALAAWREGGDHDRAGEVQAARESFARAYATALEAQAVDGDPPLPEVWNLLSNISCELGRFSPSHLGKAVRYAEAAIQEVPEWRLPWFNLALAYELSGHFMKAIDVYDRFLDGLPDDKTRDSVLENVIACLLKEADRRIREDRIGAVGEAGRLIDMACARLPNAGKNPAGYRARDLLMERFEAEANAAAEARDDLELARVHSRFGFFGPAEESLTRARNRFGRTLEVRWTGARYLDELQGTDEAYERAARGYAEMMGRGDWVVQAAAGYGRVLLAQGKVDEALDRLEGFPEPSAELRRVLVFLLLARIESLPVEEKEKADVEFEKIDELLLGGLEEWDRAEILLRVGSLAVVREDLDRLSAAIREFQNRFPRDPRAVILEAAMQKLGEFQSKKLSRERCEVAEQAPFTWVGDAEQLLEVAKELAAADCIAVDTESDSMHSYFEKVCLIQIATREKSYLLDPLGIEGKLEPLAPIFADPGIRLVLHGADYDVVCLKRDFGFEFTSIFDTMISAQCLDLERIGLADLVFEFFGETLDKKHSRTNWARRPLSDSELEYSYLDVKYLIELAEILEKRLTEADVREEAEVEFHRLESRVQGPREFDPDGYTKIRGSRDLADPERAVLRELFLMRDRNARKIDRPPFKVIANDTMLRISRAVPQNPADLAAVKGVTRYVLRRYGDQVLQAVGRGANRGKPPAVKRKGPKAERLTPRQQRQLETLKEWRKVRAAALEIPNLVILPNHAILEVVTSAPADVSELAALTTVGEKRARLHGEDILKIVNGRHRR